MTARSTARRPAKPEDDFVVNMLDIQKDSTGSNRKGKTYLVCLRAEVAVLLLSNILF